MPKPETLEIDDHNVRIYYSALCFQASVDVIFSPGRPLISIVTASQPPCVVACARRVGKVSSFAMLCAIYRIGEEKSAAPLPER